MTALCTQLHNTVSRPPLHLLSLYFFDFFGFFSFASAGAGAGVGSGVGSGAGAGSSGLPAFAATATARRSRAALFLARRASACVYGAGEREGACERSDGASESERSGAMGSAKVCVVPGRRGSSRAPSPSSPCGCTPSGRACS